MHSFSSRRVCLLPQMAQSTEAGPCVLLLMLFGQHEPRCRRQSKKGSESRGALWVSSVLAASLPPSLSSWRRWSWWGWLGQAGWRGQEDRLFWEMKGCFVVVQLLPSKHSEAFENINSLSLLALVHREAGSRSPGTARQPRCKVVVILSPWASAFRRGPWLWCVGVPATSRLRRVFEIPHSQERYF